MSVPWVRVGDVLRRRLDQVPVEPLGTYRLLGVRNHGRGAFDSGEISGSATSYRFLYRAHAGDLVYLKLGAWERAFSTVPDELDGHCASSEFVMYEPDESRLDPRYLAHLVGWDGVVTGIGAKSTGTNVRRRRLKPETFEVATIPLPDLDEQRRIAARLDVIAAGAYHLRGQGVQAAEIRERLVTAVSDGAPEERLGGLMTLERDPIAVDPDGTYEAIGVRAFGRGIIRYAATSGAALSKLAYFRVPPDSLVVSNIKAWEGAAALTAEADAHRVTSSRFLCYLPRTDEVSAGYVCAFLLSRAGIQKLGAASPGSADRNRTLGRQRFEAITVPVPPPDAQRALLMGLAQLDRYGALRDDRTRLSAALLPAARNEEFSRLTSA